ncbi:iron-containing alcohol dehydrogenase [Isosphaera pallida ATCC 43644]|uniref:Iron-containing alcohol dehydrogenase n=1 Tax=Isosphaera pallida (strain ATCC 43644 / DSM 9630 / IS1B) TaxID=575540 RepID=E8R3G3_ISOPI|nr:iron-containing alcohol dehydrogenase [Isosphaera pallida]ADV61530.1 iron-containing alcohol dehydrogenase [Isosphaera pallida ATCC 43644]
MLNSATDAVCPSRVQPPALFGFPNRIWFGDGARRCLAEELERLGIRRPLVVTDPGVRAAGLVDLVLEQRGRRDLPPLFDSVTTEPGEEVVENARVAYLDAECDGVIGLGGGAALDVAKAARLLIHHPAPLDQYALTLGGEALITPKLPPMMAIPTTAGTGSEAARGAIIYLKRTGRKSLIASEFLFPSVALCDPELTKSCPPSLTAACGMDALTHAIEAFCSPRFHPPCDALALEAIRWLRKGLEAAVANGANIEARRDVMLGALLGGIAFQKGLGVVHSLSHALGSVAPLHHGTLNAILLPHVLRFNAQNAAPRLAELADRMRLGQGEDGVRHLVTLVELVLERLPLPRRLGDLEPRGLDRSMIPRVVELALADHCHHTNPRPVGPDDLATLLNLAW